MDDKRLAVKKAIIYMFKHPDQGNLYCCKHGITRNEISKYLYAHDNEMKSLFLIIKSIIIELLKENLIVCCNPPSLQPRYKLANVRLFGSPQVWDDSPPRQWPESRIAIEPDYDDEK